MNTPASPDVIDTRLVFRVYAVLASLTGFGVFAFGNTFLGSSLAGNPYGKALIIRFIGGCIMAAGCSAAGFAQIDDRRCRHRALLWFLAAHLALVFVYITQVFGPGVPGPGDLVFWSLLAHIEAWKPAVVLQDLLLPGGLDGIETTRRLLQQCPATRVVALTASTDEARMVGVLRAGATGYVRKDADPETLLDAIRTVARGRTYIDASAAGRLVASTRTPADELTRRELDVLRQLVQGRSNKEIASALFISEETVKTHVGKVLAKLRVENRAQAIVEALRRGLIALDLLDGERPS